MAEKDMTEKTLEAYNDVFADIVNVLLFDGRKVIQEEELEEDSPRSIYKADGKLHEQERDVAKYWKNGNIRIAFYGLENQTRIDKDIPLRLISYDGAAYRAQLLDEKKERYPVVTLVLYFGNQRWTQPLSLKECLDIPKELEPYVNDYKANIYEIARLTEKQVNMFQSDFRIVADYFTQMRKNKDYIPSDQTIRHVNEVLKLMTVMTGDSRFEETLNEQEGRPRTMCEVLDRAEARGIKIGEERGEARGIEIGEAKGEAKAWYRAIENLMKATKFPARDAMKILGVPEEIQKSYLEGRKEYEHNPVQR